MPEVAVLVSPTAGRGRARALADGRSLGALRAAGLTPAAAAGDRPAPTPSMQAATAVAAGAGAVVAVGGDGTAHAALQAVAGHDDAAGASSRPAPATTWRWPSGVPADPVAAARGRRRGPARPARRAPIDAGRTGDRWWATVLCCGFDSAVTDRANRLRWPRGRRRYDVAVLAELARLRADRADRSCSTARRETLPVTLVAVGNTSWYGGGMTDLPRRRPRRRAVRRHRRRRDQPPASWCAPSRG